jgi:hypothetical protein
MDEKKEQRRRRAKASRERRWAREKREGAFRLEEWAGETRQRLEGSGVCLDPPIPPDVRVMRLLRMLARGCIGCVFDKGGPACKTCVCIDASSILWALSQNGTCFKEVKC